MSLMCPMQGCKAQKGMCIHEKMMAALVVIMAVAVAAWLVK